MTADLGVHTAWLRGREEEVGQAGEGTEGGSKMAESSGVLGIQKGKDPLAGKQHAVQSPHFKRCHTHRDSRVWFQPHTDPGSRAGQGSSLPTSGMERLK